MTTLPSKTAPTGESVSPGPKVWRVGTLAYTSSGLVALFCWLLWGDFASAMKDRTAGPVLGLLFHTFHASDLLTGLFFTSIPAAIGMVVGPIICFRSDRHRGPWGRRIPFLLIPTPIVVLSMIGLAYSPMLGAYVHGLLGPGAPDRDTIIIFSFGIFWTLFEVSFVMVGGIYTALVNDVVPQEVMGQFYGMFRALTLVAGALFNYWVFGLADTGYVWIFLAVGVFFGLGFTLMCLKVKEGEYPPVPPMDEGRDAHGFFHGAKTYFQECFGLAYYRWYFAFNAVSALITAPVGLFTLYFSKSPEIHLSTDALGKYSALMLGVSLFMAYPLGWLCDRFHPIRTSMVALVLYTIGTLWGGIFARDQNTFVIAFILNGVLSGVYFTVSSSIGQRLLPRAEFAQFASAGGIIISICAICLGPAVGWFLDHTHHHYRYTFLISAFLSALTLAGLIIVHGKFMKLGGPENYKAPEPSGKRRLPA